MAVTPPVGGTGPILHSASARVNSAWSDSPLPCTRGRGDGGEGAEHSTASPPHPHPSPPRTGERGFPGFRPYRQGHPDAPLGCHFPGAGGIVARVSEVRFRRNPVSRVQTRPWTAKDYDRAAEDYVRRL